MSNPPDMTRDARLSPPSHWQAEPDDIEIPDFLRRQMTVEATTPPLHRQLLASAARLVGQVRARVDQAVKPAAQPTIPAERIEFALDPGARTRRAAEAAALDAALEIPVHGRRRVALAEAPEYLRAAAARDALRPADPNELVIPVVGQCADDPA